jgi:hypothetical protein
VWVGEFIMALDIGIGDGKSLTPDWDEPSLYFEYHEGYYEYLSPWFERLASVTGQFVDLYGDASFQGGQLDTLEQILTETRQAVERQPPKWQVHLGTQVKPVQRELYRDVERDKMLALLDQWLIVIRRARQLNRPVVCFGD